MRISNPLDVRADTCMRATERERWNAGGHSRRCISAGYLHGGHEATRPRGWQAPRNGPPTQHVVHVTSWLRITVSQPFSRAHSGAMGGYECSSHRCHSSCQLCSSSGVNTLTVHWAQGGWREGAGRFQKDAWNLCLQGNWHLMAARGVRCWPTRDIPRATPPNRDFSPPPVADHRGRSSRPRP